MAKMYAWVGRRFAYKAYSQSFLRMTEPAFAESSGYDVLSAIGRDPERAEVISEVGKPSVETKTHRWVPKGKVVHLIFEREAQSEVDRGEMNAGFFCWLFQYPAQKYV